jgi:diaminohydroxyphosphoribosylaminopyrimidine deaminase/5-amino-6-(5-phosphoribosylamino)uracil reductase
MSTSRFDRQMMGIALTLARRALGTTAPNPAVGAVITDEATGEVIARGVTQPGGRPHAEPEALRSAGSRACGATLYVTLEPCAHYGKTPPCADAIISAGLKRVVVGVEDPDPRTRGQGLARLRAAGIEVTSGVLADAARWVTLGHILRVTAKRSFVQFKLALGADGQVPRGASGQPTFVTGSAARAVGHLLRAESDAILVGAGTVRDDNPDLTCRLPGLHGRSPIRLVLSRSLDIPLASKLVATARDVPVWVLAGEDADVARATALEAAGVRVLRVATGAAGLLPHGIGAALTGEGITRLLVEGGPVVWRSFAAAGLVDEAIVFQAGGAGPAAADLLANMAPGPTFRLADTRHIGADLMSTFRATTQGLAGEGSGS